MIEENASKPFWLSKTLWFNALTILLVIAEKALDLSFMPDHAGEIIVMIVAGLNSVLRLITSTAVTVKDERPAGSAPPALGGFTG